MAEAAGATAALQLPATVRLADAQAVAAALSAGLPARGGLALLDASPLRQFDSAVLAVLLDCTRAAQRAGVALSIAGAPPPLLELARVYGVGELLWPAAAEALTSDRAAQPA